MKNRKSLALTVELLGLFILLLLVIVIITQVIVTSRAGSIRSRRLTQAVILAESTAEAASAAEDIDGLADIMDSMENIVSVDKEGADMTGTVTAVARVALSNGSYDYYVIRTAREPSESASGVFVNNTIDVYLSEGEAAEPSGEAVYELSSGNYFGSTGADN